MSCLAQDSRTLPGLGLWWLRGKEWANPASPKARKSQDVLAEFVQITLMIEDSRNLCDLALLQAQVRIVHLGKEILGMTAIGFPDQGGSLLLVTSSQIGNAEIVRQQRNMGVRGHETFQLRD